MSLLPVCVSIISKEPEVDVVPDCKSLMLILPRGNSQTVADVLLPCKFENVRLRQTGLSATSVTPSKSRVRTESGELDLAVLRVRYGVDL